MFTLMLSSTQFRRVCRVFWVYPPFDRSEPWYQHILSKSLRKLAKRLDLELAAAEISYKFEPLTAEQYPAWQAFHAARMTERSHDVLATPDWFERRKHDFKHIWTASFYQHDSLVGTALIVERLDGTWVLAFKASYRIDLGGDKNLSLGSLLELTFVREALQYGADRVSSGTSRNAFGYHNSLGYLAFKLRMGYRPTVAEAHGFDATFPAENEAAATAWLVADTQETLQFLAYPSSESLGLELQTYLERAQLPCISAEDLTKKRL